MRCVISKLHNKTTKKDLADFVVGNQIQFTTCGSISIFFYGSTLAFWFEEPFPVAIVGVAQVPVLNDDHVSIADFFEGPKAQVVDIKMSHNHAAATTTKEKKKVEQKEKKKKRKDFMTALNNTQLLKNKFISWDPAVVNLWGDLYKEHTA